MCGQLVTKPHSHGAAYPTFSSSSSLLILMAMSTDKSRTHMDMNSHISLPKTTVYHLVRGDGEVLYFKEPGSGSSPGISMK